MSSARGAAGAASSRVVRDWAVTSASLEVRGSRRPVVDSPLRCRLRRCLRPRRDCQQRRREVGRARSASRGSRPSRRRGTPRGRPPSRWPSSPRSGCVRSGQRSRIRRVASSPSSSGIWTSIRTTSYGARLQRRDRLEPVRHDVRRVAHPLEEPEGELLVHRVVLGEQDPKRVARGQLRRRSPAASGARRQSPARSPDRTPTSASRRAAA